MGSAQASIFTRVLDALESVLLVFVLAIVWPLFLFRRRYALSQLWIIASDLLQYGLLATTLRGLLDLRFGRIDRGTASLEAVVAYLEDVTDSDEEVQPHPITAEALMGYLGVIYLANGHIEDAAVTLIRAQKMVGLDHLPNMPEMNIKVAQILKAALAAGRMIEGGGEATLLVKAGAIKKRSIQGATRQNRPLSGDKLQTDRTPSGENGAKIIPFPRPDDSI